MGGLVFGEPSIVQNTNIMGGLVFGGTLTTLNLLEIILEKHGIVIADEIGHISFDKQESDLLFIYL